MPAQATPILARMTRPEDITATIIATKNIFNAVLDENAEHGEWEKSSRGFTWERQRKYRANRVLPAMLQVTVAPQKQPLELHSPAIVVGEEKGTIRQRLWLTQTETREGSMFSQRVGGLLSKSWLLKVSGEIDEAPERIEIRDLTPQEQEEHALLGGSREPDVTVDLGTSVNLILGYEHEWFLRENSPEASRLDPHSQIGQIVLANLHETSQKLFLPGSA